MVSFISLIARGIPISGLQPLKYLKYLCLLCLVLDKNDLPFSCLVLGFELSFVLEILVVLCDRLAVSCTSLLLS